jgi:hypothetical protein
MWQQQRGWKEFRAYKEAVDRSPTTDPVIEPHTDEVLDVPRGSAPDGLFSRLVELLRRR